MKSKEQLFDDIRDELSVLESNGPMWTDQDYARYHLLSKTLEQLEKSDEQ